MKSQLVMLDAAKGPISDARSGIQSLNPKIYGRLADEGCSKDVAFVVAHPSNNFMNHYLLQPLQARGKAILALNTRYVNNETFLIMERAVQDLGRGLKYLREQGYKKICLIGNSGGASLACYYQSQAERPTVTTAPDGQTVDLTKSELVPADAIALIAAHPGRARVLTERLDASVTDERDLLATDPDLDIYNPKNGPPFSKEFVAAVRAAQLARNRRITRWCLGRLKQYSTLTPEQPVIDEPFLVHRTLGDPRYVDLTLEPNGRSASTIFGTKPVGDNYAPNGSARLCTVRSWLSQWSLDHARADGPKRIAETTVPVLSINYTQDEIIYPSDMALWAQALGDRREHHELSGSGHYPMSNPAVIEKVVDLLVGWTGKVLH